MAVTNADANNFDVEISSGIVLVDFYTDWCGPCKMIAPILDQLSIEMADVKFIKLNVDNAPTIKQKFGVMSAPTLMIFKDGKQVTQSSGFQPKEKLISWLNANK